MVNLLMIADDLTGALDSGVALVKEGISTEVIADPDQSFSEAAPGHRVIVVNANSRHHSAREAYDIVYRITRKAKELHIPHIYKKTDSAMRGNIGAELAAALEASGEQVLFFAPAFPNLCRFTRKGVQYIGDVPVSDSAFASDPLNPVTASYIPDIIAGQTDVPVVTGGELPEGPHIRIYDGETDEDLVKVARQVLAREEGSVMAGCAGFAGALAKMLTTGQHETFNGAARLPLMVFCGSIHPASRSQADYAVSRGLRRFWLDSLAVIEPGYLESREGLSLIEAICTALAAGETILVETRRSPREEVKTEEGPRVAQKLAEAVGRLIADLLARGAVGTPVIFGGDTLGGFVKAQGIVGIEPLMDLYPGVVLAKGIGTERSLHFIAKAGSFGEPELIIDLIDRLKK